MSNIIICPKPCACCGNTFYNLNTHCCVNNTKIPKPTCVFCAEYLNTNCECTPYNTICGSGEFICGDNCCTSNQSCVQNQLGQCECVDDI